MAGLLCGIGRARFLHQIFAPAIGSSAFTAISHGQLWTCHLGAFWSAPGTPWQIIVAITVVSIMISMIKVVTPDDE
jgi:hypothetical protein